MIFSRIIKIYNLQCLVRVYVHMLGKNTQSSTICVFSNRHSERKYYLKRKKLRGHHFKADNLLREINQELQSQVFFYLKKPSQHVAQA